MPGLVASTNLITLSQTERSMSFLYPFILNTFVFAKPKKLLEFFKLVIVHFIISHSVSAVVRNYFLPTLMLLNMLLLQWFLFCLGNMSS